MNLKFIEKIFIKIFGVVFNADNAAFDRYQWLKKNLIPPKENSNLLDGSVDRYSFGVNVFPSNMLEIKFQLREYKLYSIDFDTDTEYLVQLHTWF